MSKKKSENLDDSLTDIKWVPDIKSAVAKVYIYVLARSDSLTHSLRPRTPFMFSRYQ